LTAVLYTLIFPIVSHIFGFHNPLLRRDKLVLVVKYIGVATLAVFLLALVELIFFYTRVGRSILINTLGLSSVGMIALRLMLWRMSEESKRKIVVLGSSALSEHLVKLISKTGIPYDVVPLEDVACVLRPKVISGEHPLGCFQSAHGFCGGCGIHEIVACCNGDTSQKELMGLSNSLLSGFQVSDYSNFIERTFFKVPVDQIGPDWFFQINTSGDYALFLATKRLADILLSGTGMILSAPLLLLAAVLIKWESPGNVFYSQVRVGQFGRPFKIWKLRSMRNDAEKHGAQWARKGDARVTRVGRILRITRIDEVPQFYNVLRGEMSFVGPRPERPEFVSGLGKEIHFYHQRHILKPGITGWAQINYPYGATTEDARNKLKYDLYYIKHASPLLDIQTILRTIGAIMKGAR
jgi:exopolysaccharide biosynthesis polyprenyl glycosylphosphotransferase